MQTEFLKMSGLEKRVAELERKLAMMEERRAKLIPPGLDSDPKLLELQANAIKSALSKWQLTLAENGDPTAANFCELKDTLFREMAKATEESKRREAAEVAAAIEYYERTGQSPEGYNIIDDPEYRKSLPSA
jgi:hypothetical protein